MWYAGCILSVGVVQIQKRINLHQKELDDAKSELMRNATAIEELKQKINEKDGERQKMIRALEEQIKQLKQAGTPAKKSRSA